MLKRRKENQKKFKNWEELSDGRRNYYLEIKGRLGWSAKYLKEVDANEITIRFWQEIYNEEGQLVEIHEKYPIDKGHIKLNTK